MQYNHNKDILDIAVNNFLPNKAEKWLKTIEVKRTTKEKIIQPNINIVNNKHISPDIFVITPLFYY